MAQIKLKIENRSRNWESRLRFKVGDTVKHNGNIYVNTTGANSEPNVGSDWLATLSDTAFQPLLTTDGSLYIDPITNTIRGNVDSETVFFEWNTGDSKTFVLPIEPLKTKAVFIQGQRIIEGLQWVRTETGFTIVDTLFNGALITAEYTFFITPPNFN